MNIEEIDEILIKVGNWLDIYSCHNTGLEIKQKQWIYDLVKCQKDNYEKIEKQKEIIKSGWE